VNQVSSVLEEKLEDRVRSKDGEDDCFSGAMKMVLGFLDVRKSYIWKASDGWLFNSFEEKIRLTTRILKVFHLQRFS
jgi:hypothetical protein